jgi:hypothetical protein
MRHQADISCNMSSRSEMTSFPEVPGGDEDDFCTLLPSSTTLGNLAATGIGSAGVVISKGSTSTAFSGRISTSTPLFGQYRIPSPKHTYEIFCTPEEGYKFSMMCKGVVGQGSAFCTRDDCDIRSHRTKKANVMPNHLYVIKPNATAFLEPTVPKEKLEEDFYNELKMSHFTLTEWSQKMSIINKIDDKATLHTVDVEQFYVEQAMKHQTPLRTARKTGKDLNYFELTPYNRQFLEVEGAVKVEAVSSEDTVEMLKPIDLGLYEASSNLLRLISAHEESSIQLSAVSYKVDVFQTMLGNPSSEIIEDFQAPTLWGTVAILGSHINKITDTFTTIEPKLMDIQTEVNKLSVLSKDFSIKEDTLALKTRVDSVRDIVLTVCESAASNNKQSIQSIEDLHVEINEIRNVRGRHVPTTSTGGCMFDQAEIKEEIQRLVLANDELTTMFRNLSAQTEKEAIKFCSLGFRTYQVL